MQKRKGQKMRIDSREIRLGKWNIPRNEKTNYTSGGNVYYALGYFDMIGIEKIKENREEAYHHPLVQAYEYSYRLKDDFQSDYFVQEIKAFTNISEDIKLGFTDKKISKFWENNSLILCFSMLQLYLENDIENILDKIREVFSNVNYLYYFTLDYSGIIILAKDISIKDYTELLFRINYSNEESEKQVKDTFSVYGLQKRMLHNIFKMFSSGKWNKNTILGYFNDEADYEIAVNISVQNYSEYESMKKCLSDFESEYRYNSESFKLSGRHDISIVNKKTDMVWLLYVQFLLDRYTQKSVGDFYTYESFIKVKLQDTYADKKCEFKPYKKLIKKIRKAYEVFEEKAKKCGYNSYCIPVKEVCASIISILNNGFAEDFVICMYQPFFEFLEYLENKMEEQIKGKKAGIQYFEAFDKCFCSFFDGLNTLVNSAMHTDRQFIRATSFSNIFYDVPPKIMAFYVAIIYRIRTIMQTEGEKRYTFFMAPSFSDEVSVKIISYNENKMPCDRILKVSINERSLYNPEAVIRRMTHEIAHYVGGELRKRSLRKEKIIDTIVYIVLQQILHEDFKCGKAFINLKKEIVGDIINDCGIDCKKNNYSNDLKHLYRQIIQYMINAEVAVHERIRKYVLQEIESMLEEGRYGYFSEIVENEIRIHKKIVIEKFYRGLRLTSIQKEYLSTLVLKDIINEMLRLAGEVNRKSVVFSMGNTIFNETDSLKSYAKTLISLYSETYSDLQMILLLKISYEDYLKGFINDEIIDINNLEENNEDISRIAVISQLMQEKRKWNEKINCGNLNMVKKMDVIITKFQSEIKKDDSPYREQNQNLKEYLQECMKMSEEFYFSKKEINELRTVIGVLLKYDDAKRVYSTICSVISKYCHTLIESL